MGETSPPAQGTSLLHDRADDGGLEQARHSRRRRILMEDSARARSSVRIKRKWWAHKTTPARSIGKSSKHPLRTSAGAGSEHSLINRSLADESSSLWLLARRGNGLPT